MSVEGAETPEVENPEATEVADVEEREEFDEARATAKIKKVNSEAAGLRARVKELEPLAAKAKELEDAKKTETEKLAEERNSLKERAEKAESALVRAEVAAEKGLTAAQAKRLAGATKEELLEDADELLASFGNSSKGIPAPDRPKARMSGTSDVDDDPEPDIDAAVKKIRRGL